MSGAVVAYVRVSSVEQNPERQLIAVGDVDHVFEDRCSGGTRKRPALDELLRYIRAGDEVRISSMDRLARSVIDLHQIVDEMVSRGVTVRFMQEGQTVSPENTNGHMGRLLLSVLGAVSEFERAVIRERQAEGIAAAKNRGVYDRAPKLSLEQVEEAAAKVSMGVPKAQVARELGIGRTTLYKALNKEGRYEQG